MATWGIVHGGTMHKRHRRVLIDKFGIQKHGVPSYSTIRRILMGVDFELLAKSFNQWAQQYVTLDLYFRLKAQNDSLKLSVKEAK